MSTKKFAWKDGAGEFLGFAIVAPILFWIVFMVISVYQVTMAEEKMIYATYLCGRSAVISNNVSEATQAGNAILSSLYTDDMIGGIIIPGARNASFKIENGTVAWVKGNIVVISVTQDLKPIIGVMKGIRTRQLAMMIEQSQEWRGI